jgi:hypothetical protein
MRLEITRWSARSCRTVLELVPCDRVRPTAAYFRAGHLLLDSLAAALGGPATSRGGQAGRLNGTVSVMVSANQ